MMLNNINTSQNDLENLLEAQSKESLIELILSLAADSDVVEKRVKLHVLETGGDVELQQCRKLIQSYISLHADDHGYVSWRNTSRAVEGAYIASEKAHEAANNEEWLRAVSINLCIMEEMLDLLPTADDSNGSIGCVIDESHNHILEISTQSNSISTEEREKLFQMLIQESIHPLFEDWSDWKLILLESASHLATTPDLRFKLEDHLNRMISEEKDDSWDSSYFTERIAMLRYHVILSCEGKEQAAAFMRSHLQFSGFRELLIQENLEHGQYNEIIQLAKEGEKQDQTKGLRGLVKKWKKYRYEAYKLSGQIKLQRLMGEELVLEGESIYYPQLKETYSSADWKTVYRSIIEKLEKDRWPKGIYTMILIEEHENGKLLDYIRKQPSRVEDYYMHLIHEYPLEVKGLFQTHIEVTADRANSRKHYQDVCRMIQVFKQACGKEEASQIILLLKQKYPRKPAFLDELMCI